MFEELLLMTDEQYAAHSKEMFGVEAVVRPLCLDPEVDEKTRCLAFMGYPKDVDLIPIPEAVTVPAHYYALWSGSKRWWVSDHLDRIVYGKVMSGSRIRYVVLARPGPRETRPLKRDTSVVIDADAEKKRLVDDFAERFGL
jgi:hypothetical protein